MNPDSGNARTSGNPVPRVFVLTDGRALLEGRDLLEQLARAVAGGAGAVIVRERYLPARDRCALGLRLAQRLRNHHPQPLDPILGWAAPAPPPAPADANDPSWPALHLRSSDPVPALRPRLLGRSCHGIEDLRRAATEGCDYVTLSPVAATPSKPGYGPALGPAGLRDLLKQAAYEAITMPRVLALGGVTPDNARSFVRAGAHGVAVMGGFMRAADPAALAAALCGAVAA